jgi:preprotein translocase subunit SecF
MRIFKNTNFDFISGRKIAYIVSGGLMLLSIAIILFRGISYGIDFKGGQEFVLEFPQPASVTETRELLTTALGTQPEVKQFGLAEDLLIRTESVQDPELLLNTIMTTLTNANPNNVPVVIKSDTVGPRFAEDLKRGALYSVISALVVIFLYILIRFKNWTFSMGAIAALAHDVLVTLGILTLANKLLPFSMDIDQNMIAAFLTIVGYSLNDTVVIFDRIRENKTVHKASPFKDVVNRSVNDTLSRTIITTGTTLFVVLVLFIFGGEVLKGFAFALLIGMVLGTYSTVWVASSIVVDLQKRFNISK